MSGADRAYTRAGSLAGGWLARRGYAVHLIDPLKLHVDQALDASQAQPDAPPASARVGEARRLDFEEASAEAVLLRGALYHLTEPAERTAALGEARRVLQRGGVIFAVGICRFGSLLAGLNRGHLADPALASIVERDLREGQHRNPSGNPAYFTTAFFHHPDELLEEVRSAGFTVRELCGIEGPGWLVPDFDRRWADPEWRERMLSAARAVEHEPSLLGLSPHLMVVAEVADSP
jgi:SAM-dependent methyltransferase